MSKPSEIKKKIQEIVDVKPNLPIYGVVKSVTADYCSVKIKSGLVLTDVKLKATIGGDNFIKIIPKIGTTVLLLSQTGAVDNLTVIKVDEVEKVEYSQNGLEIIVDSTDGKVSIKNNSSSLVDVLSDLVTTIKGLKVFTPVGPSGTPLPTTIASLNAFEAKFKTLLK